jgi:hydrogenase maturation protease
MAASSDAALTVFAWGNESRGDDAIGAILASRVIDLGNAAINVVEDHQLNIEHVMDFEDGVPALFIDASVAIDTAYKLEKLSPFGDASISTHSISPSALLELYEQTLGKPAPDAYLLHVRGEEFELGDGISASTKVAVDRAWKFLDELFAGPCESWAEALSSASSGEAT